MRALEGGYREANPMMGGVAGSGVALYAVKGVTAAATIAVARKLAKERPLAASILMFALNTVSWSVVSHNYRATAGR